MSTSAEGCDPIGTRPFNKAMPYEENTAAELSRRHEDPLHRQLNAL